MYPPPTPTPHPSTAVRLHASRMIFELSIIDFQVYTYQMFRTNNMWTRIQVQAANCECFKSDQRCMTACGVEVLWKAVWTLNKTRRYVGYLQWYRLHIMLFYEILSHFIVRFITSVVIVCYTCIRRSATLWKFTPIIVTVFSDIV